QAACERDEPPLPGELCFQLTPAAFLILSHRHIRFPRLRGGSSPNRRTLAGQPRNRGWLTLLLGRLINPAASRGGGATVEAHSALMRSRKRCQKPRPTCRNGRRWTAPT